MEQRYLSDWRLIENGRRIPSVTYSDQPYLVKTDDGAWLCCITTGSGGEGAAGQHIITTRSVDCGESWSEPVRIEPEGAPENSYAVMLKAPGGRIYIFYTRNSDRVSEILTHDRSQTFTRVDCLGHFVYKYSDDHGQSWSLEHYDIPFRLFDCDRNNVYGGKLCFFWNVGHAFFHAGSAYVPLIKVGEMGEGFYRQSEGALLMSTDLFSVEPGKEHWETLPDGEAGLQTPPGGGPVSEEQKYLVLSDGSFYVTYRTIDGYPVEGYSRDGGRTWSEIRYMQHPDGRRIKHPRAANFAWKCENGRFLYWFHNQGGHFLGERKDSCYEDRNPAWLLPGVETDSPAGRVIAWGEPELLLYADNPMVRMSYPDFIEEKGRAFFTETEKHLARTHEIPRAFLEAMWRALEGGNVAIEAPILLEGGPGEYPPCELPELFARDGDVLNHCGRRTRKGFTVAGTLAGGDGVLLSDRAPDGRGFELRYEDARFIVILDDGAGESRMVSEPVPGAERFAVIVDGGSGIVSFVTDGRFLDGGEDRQFGWQRFRVDSIRRPNFTAWRIGDAAQHLTLYGERISTAQAVSLTRVTGFQIVL